LDDVFAVQEDVATAVIDSLNIHIAENPQHRRPADNWVAYSSFLQARAAINRLDWPQAATLLENVIELDPQFAEAHELLAFSYWHMGGWLLSGEVAPRKAYETAATAISIDPNLLFAQTLYRTAGGAAPPLKVIEVLDWAYSANQDNPRILDWLVFRLTYAGYFDEALRVAEHYVQVDPLSLDANLDLFAALYAAGRADEALRRLDLIESMGLRPNNWMWSIAGIQLAEGNDETAINYFEAFLHQHGHMDSGWVRELVTAARDPVSGQAYLDRRIPEIAKSLSESKSYNWRLGLDTWYLYFGFIDRYYELILTTSHGGNVWPNSLELIWRGHVLRGLGFTAHPDYLRLATDFGIVDVWEQRGPPDFCRKTGDRWSCD
jgi:tetratricopeptide (TPR) repeat protein